MCNLFYCSCTYASLVPRLSATKTVAMVTNNQECATVTCLGMTGGMCPTPSGLCHAHSICPVLQNCAPQSIKVFPTPLQS